MQTSLLLTSDHWDTNAEQTLQKTIITFGKKKKDKHLTLVAPKFSGPINGRPVLVAVVGLAL